MTYRVEVEGEQALRNKFEQMVGDLHGHEMLDAFRHATLLVSSTAKRRAPVDTGRLRASITPVVEQTPTQTRGIVGSVVDYAPYMELGTGSVVGGARHFPPPAALDVWARRHGMSSGFVVALAIWRRGGLEPRRFLQGALEHHTDDIIHLVEDAVTRLVNK